MNRRDFLRGLAATAATVGALPSFPSTGSVAAEEWYRQWLKDALPIYTDMYANVACFGVGALCTTDEYPFIRSIPPQEIWHEA